LEFGLFEIVPYKVHYKIHCALLQQQSSFEIPLRNQTAEAPPTSEGMFITNFVSGVVHAATQVTQQEATTMSNDKWLLAHDKHWKTCCSCSLNSSCFQLTANFPAYMQSCGRPQCARTIESWLDEA
jgi:hypothetical protein